MKGSKRISPNWMNGPTRWQIKFNVTKYKVKAHWSRKAIGYELSGKKQLTQYEAIVTKANSMLRKIRKGMDNKKQLILKHPYTDYGTATFGMLCMFWPSHHKKDTAKLKRCKRATKLARRLKHFPY